MKLAKLIGWDKVSGKVCTSTMRGDCSRFYWQNVLLRLFVYCQKYTRHKIFVFNGVLCKQSYIKEKHLKWEIIEKEENLGVRKLMSSGIVWHLPMWIWQFSLPIYFEKQKEPMTGVWWLVCCIGVSSRNRYLLVANSARVVEVLL